MYQSQGIIDSHINHRFNELLREAEHARLADLAQGPRRPLRGRIADCLFAIAEWLDGTPRHTVARAN